MIQRLENASDKYQTVISIRHLGLLQIKNTQEADKQLSTVITIVGQ